MVLSLLAALALQEPVLPPTVVTAPRAEETLTQSARLVTVVEGERLRRTGERSLPRALGRATGVWIQETNVGGGSAFVRGVTGNQILILVDGVRLNDSTTRFGPNQSLNTIDPAVVERVEIVRGPSSVLYGSDAIGGVISIWTKRRAASSGAGFDASIDALYRSVVDGARVAVEASGAGARDGWLVIGSGFDWDDLESARGTVPFSGYDGGALFGAYERAYDDGGVRASALWHRDLDVPRTDKLIVGFGQTQPSSQLYRFSLQDRQRYVLAFTDDDPALGERAQVRLSYRRYVEERERQDTGSTTFRFERDEVDTVGVGLDVQQSVGADHLLTWGLDVESDWVSSQRTDTDTTTGAQTGKDGQFAPGARYSWAGVFLQDETTAFAPVDVTAGLRASVYSFEFGMFGGAAGETSGDFGSLTASLQAARDVSDGARVTATLAQGFRAPNLDDLAKNGSFGGGTELANPNLDPERSVTAELALDLRGERSSSGLAVFWSRIDDIVGRTLTDPGTPAPGDETYLRSNSGEVRFFGVEVGGRVDVGDAGTPWALAGDATWTVGQQYDPTIDVSTGTAPFYDVPWRRVPPLHGRVALEYEQGGDAGLAWGALEVVAAADQDELHPQDVSDPRIDPLGTDGWALVNVDVGGTFGGSGTWTLGVHNLLDAQYRVHGSGFDGPGLGLVIGIGWNH